MGKARVSHIRSAQAKTTKSYVPQLITELKAARDLALIKDARQEESALRARFSGRSEVLANQRASWQLIEYFATKNGFESEKFDEILARNQAELSRIADEQKAAAIKQSSSEMKTFIHAIESKRQAFDTLISTAVSPQPFFVALDSPFLIWPTHGIELLDSHTDPYRSTAKITLDSGRTFGYEELGFYFLYENPSDRFSVINVDGYLVFNGQLRASQGGGFWPGDRHASVGVGGHLHVFEWWNQPPTEPLAQADQTQQVASVATTGGGFGDVGAIETKNVFRGVDLRHTLFVMPPHAVTVIEVTAAITYGTGTDSGHVNVDFNSGDFQIMCPFVLISVLT
ncbi:MAG: hypothetical protein HY272_09265 [Gammaproteobacteria bacterium]|nr:hypothetical protein [Gammaproteobacteria bacterium]